MSLLPWCHWPGKSFHIGGNQGAESLGLPQGDLTVLPFIQITVMSTFYLQGSVVMMDTGFWSWKGQRLSLTHQTSVLVEKQTCTNSLCEWWFQYSCGSLMGMHGWRGAWTRGPAPSWRPGEASLRKQYVTWELTGSTREGERISSRGTSKWKGWEAGFVGVERRPWPSDRELLQSRPFDADCQAFLP